MPLDPQTASKLVKFLGMTGSSHPGEVVNAAAAANRLLKSSGLTWSDVVHVPTAAATWREPENWRDAVSICLSLRDAPLSEWDRQFLYGVAGRPDLTERQTAQLVRIVEACRLHASVAA